MTLIQYSTLQISYISDPNTCLSMTCTYLATLNKEFTYLIMVSFPLVLPFIFFQIPLLKWVIALMYPGHSTKICYGLILG